MLRAARSAHRALRRYRQPGEPIEGDSTVNRIELVEKIAAAHDLSKAEAARILETLTNSIITSVKKGDPVQLIGFGTFKQAARAARTGFNPQAGAKIKIPAQKVPKFIPGAAFKAAVDPRVAKRRAEKAAAKTATLTKKGATLVKKAAGKK
jgi:DNA-binding protein HU-beta